MSRTIGRDAVDGYVWLGAPAIVRGGGPERVTTEDPPDDWTPPAPVGFTAPVVEREPLLWDGDQG